MFDSQKADLKDMINYQVETYITPEDMSLIRNTFGGNPKLLRVLRKILLPSVGDPDLPLEELSKDMWLVGIDWSKIPADEAKSLALGRELAIKFVMGGLIQLKLIANEKVETPDEKAERRRKDSTQ